MSKKGKKNKLIIFLILILVILVATFSVGTFMMGSVDKLAKSDVYFTVKENETTDIILNNLDKEKLIKSKLVAKVYLRVSKKNAFKAGSFRLSKKQDLRSIVATLSSQKNVINTNVTFVEGRRITYYADVAEKELKIPRKEFLDATNDANFINELKQKYEIIKNFNFDSKEIYQLEGLLAPDTYNVAGVRNAKELIHVLVAQSDKKYKENLELYKKSKLSINEIYTLASIVETEAKTPKDRILVASIFMNRIKNKISLGSDVTTYYGIQVDYGKRDLTVAEIREKNAYNTRATSMLGLPVGPIDSPSQDSIVAALSYKPTKYLFFVADKFGKTYAAKNYDEHEKIINDLKEKGMWHKYKE